LKGLAQRFDDIPSASVCVDDYAVMPAPIDKGMKLVKVPVDVSELVITNDAAHPNGCNVVLAGLWAIQVTPRGILLQSLVDLARIELDQ